MLVTDRFLMMDRSGQCHFSCGPAHGQKLDSTIARPMNSWIDSDEITTVTVDGS